MSKRKPAKASKHARSPKIAAKAQRATQAIVRSPKDSRLRSIAAGSNESPFKRHDDDPKQDAPLVTALQDDCRQMATTHNLNKGFDFSSATASVRAYQAKLLEMAQADLQFAFEFTQRLARIRSPVEFPSVIAEFTRRRISMFRKYWKEMVELSTKPLTA
jgi:Phasin protein